MSDRDPDALDAVTNEDRFTVELEFVQSLANPRYVHFLASKGVLRDDRFIAYLRYLRYWERPEYAKFILYPHCLRFRRLLLDDAFRSIDASKASAFVEHMYTELAAVLCPGPAL